MTLRQIQRIARSYGMYVKKSRSKWGQVYQVGFTGGRKADSIHVRTLQEALDAMSYVIRETA